MHAARFGDASLYQLDERVHVGRRRPGFGDEEVGVFLRDHGAPDAQALATGGLDEPSGRVVGGFVNTEPAFCPPGWCSRRQRTISSMRAAQAAGSSPRPENVAPTTTARGASAEQR